MSTKSLHDRLDALERGIEWHNPEPGVLTWRDYRIFRNDQRPDILTLQRGDWGLNVGSQLADLKAIAERDFAERVELGEIVYREKTEFEVP